MRMNNIRRANPIIRLAGFAALSLAPRRAFADVNSFYGPSTRTSRPWRCRFTASSRSCCSSTTRRAETVRSAWAYVYAVDGTGTCTRPISPETLPCERRGVSATAEPPALFVIGPSGGARHLLQSSGLVTIGRAATCAIVLDDLRASRSNAALHLSETISINDLGSENGTLVGGRGSRVAAVAAVG
jgi:hypothetical protein